MHGIFKDKVFFFIPKSGKFNCAIPMLGVCSMTIQAAEPPAGLAHPSHQGPKPGPASTSLLLVSHE